MRRVLVGFSHLLWPLLILVAASSSLAVGEVVVFDSTRLLSESKRLATKQAVLKSEWESKDREVGDTEKALRELVRAGTASAGEAKPEGLEGLRATGKWPPEKVAEVKALNESLDQLKRDALGLRSKAREELRTEIVAAVRRFAQTRGYTMVFDLQRAGVVHVDESADVTTALIQWIDQDERKEP